MLKTITKSELQEYFEKLFFQDNRANRLDMNWNSQSQSKSTVEGGEEGGAAAAEGEPEPVPSYETEKKHASADHFKKSMGLFVDNYKLAYASTNFSL